MLVQKLSMPSMMLRTSATSGNGTCGCFPVSHTITNSNALPPRPIKSPKLPVMVTSLRMLRQARTRASGAKPRYQTFSPSNSATLSQSNPDPETRLSTRKKRRRCRRGRYEAVAAKRRRRSVWLHHFTVMVMTSDMMGGWNGRCDQSPNTS